MIQSIIDNALKTKRSTERKSSGKFSVSGAGKCRLARYWDRMKKEGKEEPNERAYRVFEVGHIFEKWIVSLVDFPVPEGENPLLHSYHGIVEDEHRKGEYDVILNVDGKKILYDFKTVHSRKFHNNNKQGWDKDIHYHHQIVTYWDMLKEKPDECRLCYISKDDLCIQEVPVYPDKIIDAVREDWALLIGAWTAGIEPEANPLSWECKKCGYKNCQFKNKKDG